MIARDEDQGMPGALDDAEAEALLALLDGIDTDDEAHRSRTRASNAWRMKTHYERELAERIAAYVPRTRTLGGRVWDLLAPGTEPHAGDEVEDEGVWRPRRVIADCKTRYDRAVFLACEAQRQYDANPSEVTKQLLDEALQRRARALRESETETVRTRDRINEWRAGEGREVYNARRRSVRATPNADLSAMTDEEKAAHKREQARLRKQRSRAKAHARNCLAR
ncbi:hypothetical protein [Phaeovulum vinaykumarii]|uniref:hypothetical protein n=1 Tax=Phaeovulum vinaykumarii TaxID=407234 RepID=UPI00117A0F3E|nr:hypothetical protein [Phaeovulum vinaykumarii]